MELRVGDAMTRGVIYATPKDNIQKIAEIMKKNDIESVIVMEKGKGVGIVTDTDIINKVVATGKDPKKTQVSAVMSKPLLTIAPDKDIEQAAKMMVQKDVKRLVVAQNHKIIGVISEFDLVKVEPALHTLISEHSKWDIADIPANAEQYISGRCESCDNYSDKLTTTEGKQICEDCERDEE
jgi:CBS domain-containing protein